MIPLLLVKDMVDSLYVINHPQMDVSVQASAGGLVDWILTGSMALIALFDIFLTIRIFRQNRKDNSEMEQKHRTFELMQLLILNSKLNLLYTFYDLVMEECKKLQSNSSKQTKDEVNAFIKAQLKVYRRDFISLFNVVDVNIYISLLKEADNLIDGITESIYDQGVNLEYEPKFDEMISQPLSKSRVKMLSILYSLAA